MPRAHGEGSIFKRGTDGRWVAALRIHGKQRRRYSKTQWEARRNLAQLHREAQSFAEPGLLKFREFAATWLEQKRLEVRPTTWTSYEKLLRLYAGPELGETRLDRLRPRHLSHLYSKTKKSARTIGQLHRVVHAMLKDAVRQGEMLNSPADLVSPPPVKRYEYPVITVEQAERIFKAARGDQYEAFVYLAVQGLRSGEILALRWDDLSGNSVYVRGTLHREKGGGWRVGSTKTTASMRRVGLMDNTLAALLRTQRVQLVNQLAAGSSWEDHGFIFANAIGRPLRQDTMLKQFFHPLLDRASLPKMRVHDLRHNGASILLAMGVAVTDISEQWGHSSPYVTLNMYAHTMPESGKRIAEKLNEKMGQV